MSCLRDAPSPSSPLIRPPHHHRIDPPIVVRSLKSDVSRRAGVTDRCDLFYRWKDEAEQGAKAALGGRSAARPTEKDHRIRQLERTLGRKALEMDLKKRRGGVSCGEVHSQAREMVTQATRLRW